MYFTLRLLPFIASLMVLVPLAHSAAQETPPESTTPPTLLSAFFGLDNALPLGVAGLCRGAQGQDGMPVIFSAEINPDTLQAEDFAVITESGAVHTPFCVTLSPAVDTGELRTVLVIGELGSAEDDPPIRVDIVDEILTADRSADFNGASVAVTPLADGPTLILAESVPQAQWALNQRSGRQRGDGCPSTGTRQIVRATWAGGISNSKGDEAGEPERALYRVNVRQTDGTVNSVTPFALADLGDGDNNHLLCLDVEGAPISVFFPAGHLYDPNSDVPNPDTQALVMGGALIDTLNALTTAYSDPVLDPTAAAWAQLLAHPDYTAGEIVFLEIAALDGSEMADAQYDAYLEALIRALDSAGGELILAYDIVMEGTGDLYELEDGRYRGGAAYTARLPSRAALVNVLLDDAVIEAHTARRPALTELQAMLGADSLPDMIANLPKNVDAASIDTPYTDGKSPETLLDELLSIYPDGGADPTREQLEMLLNAPGFEDEPLYYINLYDWGSYGEAGAATHDAYNQGAQVSVFAHGVRVYARVDIEQNLVGPYDWDRLILPRWPSFEVFTDLRLVPEYIDAQALRVDSADIYGNYIATERGSE